MVLCRSPGGRHTIFLRLLAVPCILLPITLSGRFTFSFSIRSSRCTVDSEVIIVHFSLLLLGACELEAAQLRQTKAKASCLVSFVHPSSLRLVSHSSYCSSIVLYSSGVPAPCLHLPALPRALLNLLPKRPTLLRTSN